MKKQKKFPHPIMEYGVRNVLLAIFIGVFVMLMICIIALSTGDKYEEFLVIYPPVFCTILAYTVFSVCSYINRR